MLGKISGGCCAALLAWFTYHAIALPVAVAPDGSTIEVDDEWQDDSENSGCKYGTTYSKVFEKAHVFVRTAERCGSWKQFLSANGGNKPYSGQLSSGQMTGTEAKKKVTLFAVDHPNPDKATRRRGLCMHPGTTRCKTKNGFMDVSIDKAGNALDMCFCIKKVLKKCGNTNFACIYKDALKCPGLCQDYRNQLQPNSPAPTPPASCADKPPSSGKSTCAQQKSWGKCGKTWMKGFCCKTCFGCQTGCGNTAAIEVAEDSNRKSVNKEQLVRRASQNATAQAWSVNKDENDLDDALASKCGA